MRKIISKTLIIFIILIIMFEFIFSSNVSYALDISDEFINSLTSLAGGIVAYGIWFQRVIGVAISTIFNEIMSVGFAASCGVNWGSKLAFATPYTIFFNKYKLFDVNYFDIGTGTGIIESLRAGVAEWFYILRTISASILLCVLIYIGIRMAISTVADEKAKYKKMFFDWACSLALIFVLQYIAVFTIYANNTIVNALKEMHTGTDMDTAILQIATQAVMPVGLGSIVATFVYIMIIFQTIAFMISYLQRVLKVGFLLMISPLISITYSIDKVGDGKAQALNTWLKEFVYTILIQPFHCIIYMAFVSAAIALLSKQTILGAFLNIFTGSYNQLANGVLVILCLKFVNDGETAIRKIFNFQDDGNLTSMAAGAMVGLAVIQNAQKIGGTAAKGLNVGRNFVANFGQDIKNIPGLKDSFAGKMASGIANSPIGTGAQNAAKWIGDKNNAYKKWSADKHAKWAAEANDPTKNRLITGAKSWLRKGVPTTTNLYNALPGALGMMGAAMSYATGTSGAMEALGMGAGFQKGADEFFSSTLTSMGNEYNSKDDDHIDAQLEQEKYKRNDDIRNAATEASPDGNVSEDYTSDSKINSEIDAYAKNLETLGKFNELDELEKIPEDELTKEQRARKDELKDELKDKDQKEIEDKVKKAEEKYSKAGVLAQMQKRAELSTESGQKKFRAAKKKENAIDDNPYSTKEIETKAEAVLAAIMDLKLKKKREEGTDDSEMNNVLTADDVSSAEKTLDSIRKTIDRSFIKGSGGSFDMSRMLQNEMGLDDDGSEAYQAIMRAALSYREAISKNRAEEVSSNWGKLNGTRESLIKKATGSSIEEITDELGGSNEESNSNTYM